MAPNPPTHRAPQPSDQDQASSLEHPKAIRADAFDRFIEEQLQREVLDGNSSEFEVVCHAY
jgi:hypothetical protein